MSASYAATILGTPGLAAYWRLGETAGTTAFDASPAGQNATDTGCTLAQPGALAGDPNLAYGFDGTDDFLQAPNGVWFSGDFTVEAWVKPSSLPADCRVLDFGNGAPSDNVILAAAGGNDTPTLFVFVGTAGSALYAPNALPTNAWSHLVATLNGTTAAIYVNGAVVASGTVSVPNAVARSNCYLGRSNWTADPYYPGSLDEVAIYARALSAGEVAAHYQLGTRTLAIAFPTGQIQVVPALRRADASNTLKDDLTALALGDLRYSVTTPGTTGTRQPAIAKLDLTQAIPWTFEADLQSPAQLTPIADCLAPFLTLNYPNGQSVTAQVGLYVVLPPPTRSSALVTTGLIDARGLEWLLSMTSAADQYTVAAGTDYVAAVTTLLSSAGLARWAIPLSGKTLPVAMTWKPGTDYLTIANALLKGCGYWPLSTDRVGVFRSGPMYDLLTKQPAVTYANGAASVVVGEAESEPVKDGPWNKVLVIVDHPSRAPFVATATNTNPASPTSTVALGRTITKVVKEASTVDAATAQAIADATLQQGSILYPTTKLRTLPDPTRDPHEVYALDLTDVYGNPVAVGNYFCLGWELRFVPDPTEAPMLHTLGKLNVWQ